MASALRSLDVLSDPSSSVDREKMHLQNKIASTSSPSLSTLPGEIISEILQFTMQSEEPLYIWLFPGLKHSAVQGINILSGYDFRCPPRYPSRSVFEKQEQHFSDWRSVTSTCRRFRDYGIPAFFREKRFVIPCRLFRMLYCTEFWDMGKVRLWRNDQGRYLNVMECIQNIIVPTVAGPFFGLDELPRYDLTSLASITIWAEDELEEETKIVLEKIIRDHGDLLKGIDIKVEGVAIPWDIPSRPSIYRAYTTLEPTLTTRLSVGQLTSYYRLRMYLQSKEGIPADGS